jgi:hypothetical protein
VTYNEPPQRRKTMLSLAGPAIVATALTGRPGAYASLISATGMSVQNEFVLSYGMPLESSMSGPRKKDDPSDVAGTEFEALNGYTAFVCF